MGRGKFEGIFPPDNPVLVGTGQSRKTTLDIFPNLPDGADGDVGWQSEIPAVNGSIEIFAEWKVRLCNLSKSVDTRIGATGTHNFHFLPKHHRAGSFQYILDSVGIRLTLPTAVIGTIVRNLQKVPSQFFAPGFDLDCLKWNNPVCSI
jgi:hypothetical protein